MRASRVRVHPHDGGPPYDVRVSQYGWSRWAQHCRTQGWVVDPTKPESLALTSLWYAAWSELRRDPDKPPGAPASFAAWEEQTDEVELLGNEPVDPTQPVPGTG